MTTVRFAMSCLTAAMNAKAGAISAREAFALVDEGMDAAPGDTDLHRALCQFAVLVCEGQATQAGVDLHAHVERMAERLEAAGRRATPAPLVEHDWQKRADLE